MKYFNKIKQTSLFLALVFLNSCSDSKSDAPENLLTQIKMVEILTYIHIAEAKISNKQFQGDSSLMMFQKLQNEIFVKNKVKKEDYDKSYQYYLDNITLLDDIYARVVDSLSLREAIKKID